MGDVGHAMPEELKETAMGVLQLQRLLKSWRKLEKDKIHESTFKENLSRKAKDIKRILQTKRILLFYTLL